MGAVTPGGPIPGHFPSAVVYGPTRAAELRIVTCGGAFDRAAHEYTGNVVLFAHLTGAS